MKMEARRIMGEGNIQVWKADVKTKVRKILISRSGSWDGHTTKQSHYFSLVEDK